MNNEHFSISEMIEMQNKGLIARKNGKRNGEWIVL